MSVRLMSVKCGFFFPPSLRFRTRAENTSASRLCFHSAVSKQREGGKQNLSLFFLRFPASSSKTFSASAFPGRGGNILLQSFSERKAREKKRKGGKKRVNSTARGMPESCYLVVAE